MSEINKLNATEVVDDSSVVYEKNVRIFCSECGQYLSWCLDCLADFCPGCEDCGCDNECAR